MPIISRGRVKATWLQVVIHILGWLPLAWILFTYFAGRLSVNPIQDIEQRLGRIGVYFLIATLACTPLSTLFGWREFIQRRRALGLYAFLYISFHVLVFFGLDYGFILSQVFTLVIQKLYLIAGALALLMLIPLAVTSFDYFIRKMGKNWKRLHWLIYPSAIISILHYALAQKGDLFALRGNILVGNAVAPVIGLTHPFSSEMVQRNTH
jgi:sulfoxide reductase heme-binding subunit YedZ